MLEMKYNELTAFPFQMVMQKLKAAPTTAHTAYRLQLMGAEIKKARDQISKEFKTEMMEVYAKRDEAGKFDEKNWTVDETKREEYTKKEEEFGERIAKLDRPKLTVKDIRVIQPTADEIEALLPILDPAGLEEEEPAAPAPAPGGKKLRHA